MIATPSAVEAPCPSPHLSTWTLVGEQEVDELLGLPEDAATMGLVPLGYPARGRWSTPRRQPVEEVVHWERWGTTRTRE